MEFTRVGRTKKRLMGSSGPQVMNVIAVYTTFPALSLPPANVVFQLKGQCDEILQLYARQLRRNFFLLPCFFTFRRGDDILNNIV